MDLKITKSWLIENYPKQSIFCLRYLWNMTENPDWYRERQNMRRISRIGSVNILHLGAKSISSTHAAISTHVFRFNTESTLLLLNYWLSYSHDELIASLLTNIFQLVSTPHKNAKILSISSWQKWSLEDVYFWTFRCRHDRFSNWEFNFFITVEANPLFNCGVIRKQRWNPAAWKQCSREVKKMDKCCGFIEDYYYQGIEGQNIWRVSTI